MSILLESLNQGKQPSDTEQKGIVPTVNDSHFDDEMFSDELVQRQLKFWKIASILLISLLIISWVGFYQYSVQKKLTLQGSVQNLTTSQNTIQTPEAKTIVTIKKGLDKVELSKTNQKTKKINAITESDSVNVIGSKVSQINNVEIKYQPKKMTAFSSINNKVNSNEMSKTMPVVKNSSGKKENINGDISKVVEYESLNELQQSKIPALDISSYAISSNVNKSFVVLNGSFYGQGETIAPHLTLVSIDKNSILIRYKNQLIRKKYN